MVDNILDRAGFNSYSCICSDMHNTDQKKGNNTSFMLKYYLNLISFLKLDLFSS